MSGQHIIMNFTRPPGLDDLHIIVNDLLPNLPDELLEHVADLAIQIEEFPDEALEQEFDLDDPFDLPILYRSGKEISPGVEKKSANDDHLLILFRRPILDFWCETHEELSSVVRQLLIEELGRVFDFADDDVEDMMARHYQGLL